MSSLRHLFFTTAAAAAEDIPDDMNAAADRHPTITSRDFALFATDLGVALSNLTQALVLMNADIEEIKRMLAAQRHAQAQDRPTTALPIRLER
jgi:hypothetical protein